MQKFVNMDVGMYVSYFFTQKQNLTQIYINLNNLYILYFNPEKMLQLARYQPRVTSQGANSILYYMW